MAQVTATAIQHVDVNGKKLYYVRVTNGKETFNINVGESTYNKIQHLENGQEETTEANGTVPDLSKRGHGKTPAR